MPWRETNPMKQRKEFIDKFLTGRWTMTELSDRFGISRVTHGTRVVAGRKRPAYACQRIPRPLDFEYCTKLSC